MKWITRKLLKWNFDPRTIMTEHKQIYKKKVWNLLQKIALPWIILHSFKIVNFACKVKTSDYDNFKRLDMLKRKGAKCFNSCFLCLNKMFIHYEEWLSSNQNPNSKYIVRSSLLRKNAFETTHKTVIKTH